MGFGGDSNGDKETSTNKNEGVSLGVRPVDTEFGDLVPSKRKWQLVKIKLYYVKQQAMINLYIDRKAQNNLLTAGNR